MHSNEIARAAALTDSSDSLFRKISWRILPLLFISYCVAFLDRVNVGFTQLKMGESIGLGPAQYGFAAGIFFVSYALCEMPSNALFVRMGARKTFLRIMVLWGVTVAATAFVRSPAQFYAMRLLLGIFEAGFFPGMILYLSYWFPTSLRARVTAAVAFANSLAATIAGPLTTGIMTGLDGSLGLHGWQWVFITQGLPACLLGFICYRYLSNSPVDADWLAPTEKSRLRVLMEQDARSDNVSHGGMLGVLKDPAVYILAAIYFSSTAVNYLVNFWLPTLIKESGVSNVMNVGLLTMLPMLAGCCGLLLINWSSDRLAERRLHLAGCYLLAAIGLLASTALTHSTMGLVIAFCVSNVGVMAAFPLFWTLPPTYLRPDVAPAGIAFISMLGITAGFLSPYALGLIKGQTGTLTGGVYAMAALLAVAVVLILFIVPAAAVHVSRRVST